MLRDAYLYTRMTTACLLNPLAQIIILSVAHTHAYKRQILLGVFALFACHFQKEVA